MLLPTTQAGDVVINLPKLREGSWFPDFLEPRRRVDQALYAVVMTAYISGTSTRKVDRLVKSLGSGHGISKSEVSRIGRATVFTWNARKAGASKRITLTRRRRFRPIRRGPDRPRLLLPQHLQSGPVSATTSAWRWPPSPASTTRPTASWR